MRKILMMFVLILCSCSTTGTKMGNIELRKEFTEALKRAIVTAENNGYKKEEILITKTEIGVYAVKYKYLLENYKPAPSWDPDLKCSPEVIDFLADEEKNMRSIIENGKKSGKNGVGLYLEVSIIKYLNDEEARYTRGGEIFNVAVDLSTNKLIGCERISYK